LIQNAGLECLGSSFQYAHDVLELSLNGDDMGEGITQALDEGRGYGPLTDGSINELMRA
jgi:hypothetical protein